MQRCCVGTERASATQRRQLMLLRPMDRLLHISSLRAEEEKEKGQEKKRTCHDPSNVPCLSMADHLLPRALGISALCLSGDNRGFFKV